MTKYTIKDKKGIFEIDGIWMRGYCGMCDCKKIMILAPHQDDEIILCGSFLNKLVELQYQIFVVFMTNGDYEEGIGIIRLKEALEVMRLYHIPEERVIFMGYANEYDKNGPHIYNASEGQIVYSQFGNGQTYGLPHHPEYYYQKTGRHHTYQRENLVTDLYDIMMEIVPDIIFATDMEIHPDHKANSLFLDEVLGKCFRENASFRPIVLKKPEYNSAWFGKRDYNVFNNAQAEYNHGRVYVNNQVSQFSNPYIRWNDRLRLPIDEYARTLCTEDNIVYQALKTYDSQNAIDHFDMLLNSDVVFWKRRTDSLTYNADITVSSGEAYYLNDFKIVDSTDIKRKSTDEWNVNASVWRPVITDKMPTVTIALKEETLISEVRIYQEFCPESQVLESDLIMDGQEIIEVGSLEKRRPTIIRFSPRRVKKIEYIIKKCSKERKLPGITEIEVYPVKYRQMKHIKIMLNDNFIYDYFTEGELHDKLQIYQIYDDASADTAKDLSDYHVALTDMEGNGIAKEKYIRNGHLYGILESPIKIYVTSKNNAAICDEIVIYKRQHGKNKGKRFQNTEKFFEQIEKAYYVLGEKEYLSFLKKEYYLYKSQMNIVKCNILKAEFARRFYSLRHQAALTENEKEECKCFLMTGEIQPIMPRYIKEYLRGLAAVKAEYCLSRRIYLIGTPDHYNIGDHIITYATCVFLQDIVPEIEIIEISMKEFPRKLPELQKNIRQDDILILQGGGNMGNIYWRNERIRREIIKRFYNNKIIIFPETIYYTKDCEGTADLAISQSIYEKAAKLVICAREKVSYEIMNEVYPWNTVILVPDMVCYLEPNISVSREKVKLFYRSDLEKSISEALKQKIEEFLKDRKLDYEYKDMMHLGKGYIGKANRDRIVWNKIKEIAGAKLVITDRLHAMILSVITGTPCLVIAEYNHKIESAYYTWFETVPYIVLLKDSSKLEEKAKALLEMPRQPNIKFKDKYEALIMSLKEEL
ncbi:MAG: polysaccharide pyruvyl transferase family protein [Eubacterium sp.]|nr:polysaccharide pyruvyl transferase family protein [Eubacterium sp.]